MRAIVVVPSQLALASGDASSKSRKSDGNGGSRSSADGRRASVTLPPVATPAVSISARGILSQWLNWPSGSRVASNGWPSIVPVTLALPRRPNLPLTAFGSTTNAHASSPPISAGRRSFALKSKFITGPHVMRRCPSLFREQSFKLFEEARPTDLRPPVCLLLAAFKASLLHPQMGARQDRCQGPRDDGLQPHRRPGV